MRSKKPLSGVLQSVQTRHNRLTGKGARAACRWVMASPHVSVGRRDDKNATRRASKSKGALMTQRHLADVTRVVAGGFLAGQPGLACLWPPPFSATWHCAHLVLKIFSPLALSPSGGQQHFVRIGTALGFVGKCNMRAEQCCWGTAPGASPNDAIDNAKLKRSGAHK